MSKITDGLTEALNVAKCEHVFVRADKQPSDKRYVRRHCTLCKATFISPQSDMRELLHIVVKGAPDHG
jgi:hypothetical protein